MNILQAAIESGQRLGKLALYFGCWEKSGHYLYDVYGGHVWEDKRPVDLPWDEGLMDTGLLENRKVPDIPDGRVHWTCGGNKALWYAFVWWDRSVDTRGACNSGFYVRGFGWPEAQEAFDYACAQFPFVVKRQRYELILQERETKGSIRTTDSGKQGEALAPEVKMINTFAGVERAKADLLREKDKRTAEHQSWLAAYEAQTTEMIQRTSLLTQGVDVARLDRARKVLRVNGDSTKIVLDRDGTHGRETRANAIAYAKQLLAESPEKLKEKYVGVKNYDSFGDQRDDHQYGMGPRHGSIVFSIGLTEEVRKRDLTAEEIEDALYLLHVLPALAEAQKKAA